MSDAAGVLALEAVDGATVTLERFPIVIGRLVAGDPVPDVDVGHLDPAERVAPAHCRLTGQAGGVLVHDLGAPSGTWVDGTRVRPGRPRLLALGRVLRVADVELTLVEFVEPDMAPVAFGPIAASLVSAPPPPAVVPGPSDPSAPAPGERPPVPPPPSIAVAPGRVPLGDRAGPGGAPPVRPPDEVDALAWLAPGPLDVESEEAGDAARSVPAEVRRWLDAGAVRVRLVAGEPALVYRAGVWEPEGATLTVAAVETAIAEARRALGLRDARPAGTGRAGGLLFDWAAPPLTRAAYLAAERGPRQPAALEPEQAAAVAGWLARGRSLVAVAPWTASLLAALAALAPDTVRPRAVPAEADAWWVPPGWPVFAGVPELPDDVDALLAGGLAIVERPSPAELRRLLDRAGRGQGALVVGVEGTTVQAGLDALVLAVEKTPGALEGGPVAALARAFPAAVAGSGGRLDLLALGERGGRWATGAFPEGGGA